MLLKEVLQKLHGEADIEICDAEARLPMGEVYYKGLVKDVPVDLLDAEFDYMESRTSVGWDSNNPIETLKRHLVFEIYII